MDLLLLPSYISIRADGPAFDLFFPCTTLESFAVAVLEVVPNDAKCLLDITSLVQGGWSEAFKDLIEYEQESTNFYKVLQNALADIESLATTHPHSPILARLLYANAITAMEVYLGDTVKRNVMNRPALLRRFVEGDPSLKNEKLPVAEVFRTHDGIKERVSKILDDTVFHNLAKTMKIYESVFAVRVPVSSDQSSLCRAVERRHDIIHRNGRDFSDRVISDRVIEVTASDLDQVVGLVIRTMGAVDKQIKDGLVDGDYET